MLKSMSECAPSLPRMLSYPLLLLPGPNTENCPARPTSLRGLGHQLLRFGTSLEALSPQLSGEVVKTDVEDKQGGRDG